MSRSKKSLRVQSVAIACVSLLAVAVPAKVVEASTASRISFTGAQGHYVVAAGSAVGTVFGEVRAVKTGSADVLTYSMSDGSGLEINSASGVLTVADSSSVAASQQRSFEVTASDGTSSSRARFNLLVMPASTLTHGITEQRWDDLKGTGIDDVKVAMDNGWAPSAQADVPQINRSLDRSTYGVKYSGFVVAPSTGSYTFWISADESAALWLGANGNVSSLGQRPIATQALAISRHSWGIGTMQQSAPVNLVAGQVYAIKVVHKESYYGDHVAVAWKGPGMSLPVNGSAASVIPQSALYPISAIDWSPPPKPAYTTVSSITATTVTLSWRSVSDTSGVDRYIVARDGRKIADVAANGGTLYHYDDVIKPGVHRYAISAVDGKGNISPPANLTNVSTGRSFDPVAKAISTGDPNWLTDSSVLVSRAQAEVASLLVKQNDLMTELYSGVGSMNYIPASTGGSTVAPFGAASDRVLPIVKANNTSSTVLAAGGTTTTGSRFAAFGDTPLTEGNSAAAIRLVQWLITGSGSASPSASSTIAILNNKSTAMKAWLIAKGIGSNSSITVCTAANYATCFVGKSLIIGGSKLFADPVAAAPGMVMATKQAMAAQTPILWSADFGYPSDKTQDSVLPLLGAQYTGSTWYSSYPQAVYTTSEAVTTMAVVANQYSSLSTMLGHFAASDWNVDFTGCDFYGCGSNPTAEAYVLSEFLGGAKSFVQIKLSDLDTRGMDIFDEPPAAYRLLKILVLLGDLYRRDISYPSTPNSVSNSEFFRTYFADFSVYNLRKHNPAQGDLGTFAWPIPSTVARFNDTPTFETKTEQYFTAVGSYALPGESFTVNRTDSASVVIEVAVNELRPSSTHEYHAYVRPKFLRSPWIALQKGVPLTVTSPYGGPIQIRIGSSDPSVAVSVALTNVGHHPVWDGPETSAAFSAGMAENIYNWAEIKTPGIEIHSNRRLMLDTLRTTAFNTPDKLSSSTFKYHFQSQYGVAGYIGAGLPVSDSVQALCTENGLDCANRSINKVPAISHFNADKGSCGYGCSGNPYDADWAYSVIGWGDSHEIGHNIQRFMIYDGKSTETTNDIYSAHTLGKWNKEVPYYWQGAAFSTKPGVTFDAIIRAQQSSDPVTFMKDVVWGTMQSAADRLVPEMQWDVQRMHFFWHLVQQSRENTRVNFGNDGWDFWTLMNAIDREFYYVSSDQARWDARATSIGFGGMTRDAAKALNNNSRTLVQASRLAKLDQRPFFDMWGVTYSQEASLQVASFNYDPAPKRYWYYPTTFEGSAYFSGIAAGSLPVDGSVTSLPVVPVAFNFTPADISSPVYPWPQITRVAVKKSIELKTAVGAASVVEFKANGVVIPDCGAVSTQTHDWTRDYNSKAGGQGGGAKEVVATCVWYPQTAGSFAISTRVTPNNSSLVQPVTDPITITALDTDDVPAISSVSSTMGLEGSTVILRGVNLRTTSTVTYKGVNVPIVARSATRITVTVPAVTPDQVNDFFTLFTTTGYRVVSPTQFVVRKPVSSVVLGASNLTVKPGKVVTMAATVNPSYATNKSLIWSSSDPSVATVSSSGKIVAKQIGTTTITASAVDNSQFGSVVVVVTSEEIIDVLALTGSPVAVDLGSTVTAQVSPVPSNATASSTTWTSAAPAVASVTSSGLVTGVARGSTTLTATSANGVSTTIAVTVNVAVTSDDVNNTIPGLTTQMQFSTNNGTSWTTFTGSNLPALTGNIMVKVRATGTTTPVKSLLFTDGTNSVTNPATGVVPGNIYLSDITATSQTSGWGPVELDSSNKGTSSGDGTNLTINGVTYAKGLGVHANSSITYDLGGKYARFRSDVGPDDEDPGSVVFDVVSDGVVLFTSGMLRKVDGAKVVDVNVVGKTTLTINVDGGGWTGSDHADWAGARLVPAVSSVTVTPQSAATTPGTVTTLVGVPVVETGVTASLTWSSSNTNVATVDANGVVTSVANGTAIITATSSIGTASATSTIRVSAPRVTSLALNTSSLLLTPAETSSLVANVAHDVGADAAVTWATANSAVATVDASGNVLAVAIGSAVVTATAANGDFEASATVVVSSSVNEVSTLTAENKLEASPAETETTAPSTTIAPSNTADVRVLTSGKYLEVRSPAGLVRIPGATVTAKYVVGKGRAVYTCSLSKAKVSRLLARCKMPRALQLALRTQRIAVTLTSKSKTSPRVNRFTVGK